jgi:D-alanine-D-alanine ligase
MAKRERITVLYNRPVLPADHPDHVSEIDVLDSVEAVQQVLDQAGYDTTRLAVGNDASALIDGLRHHAPDAVVNLFEGTADNNANELYAAGILEWLGLSYTGCPFHTLVLARSKHQAKRLFLADGIPTAPFIVCEGGEVGECPLKFPCVVKPTQQDASVGVEQASVVTNLEELRQRVRYVFDQFAQPVLVEEFIAGREVTFALAEMPDLRLLPGTEVIFPPPKEGYWPILTYDAKWEVESYEFNATDYHFHAEFTPEQLATIEGISRRVFRLLGCRDYARVDFRIREGDNQPFVLELNPNPDMAPDRALSNNLWAADIKLEEFIRQLVANALARRQAKTGTRYDAQAG